MSVLLTTLCALATAGCGGLLIFVLLDLTGHDRGPAMAAYVGMAPLALLPAWPALLLGLLSGRWWCAAAAALPCLAQLAAVRTAWSPGPKPPVGAAGATLRVATANVFFRNQHAQKAWPILTASNPDVVALQEVSALSGGWLLPPGWTGRIEAREDAFGAALLAAPGTTLLDARVVELDGLPAVRGEVDLEGARVAVWCVHPKAPTGSAQDRQWRRQLAELAALLAAEELPVVVVGDFNATPAHREFRRLLAVGRVRDVRPRGFGGTWPARFNRRPPCPPRAMALDHVLVRGLAAHSVRRLKAAASDHHPLFVELSLERL